MSDCDRALEQLYALLDGEIGPEEAQRIRAHLAECAHCLQEFDLDRMLKALIRRSCACESAPAALRTRIIERITTVTVRTTTWPVD